MPRPGFLGRSMQPSTICSGSFVRRSRPSCQIQWVSMPFILPGIAAAHCTTIAREMSKWLLLWQPHMRPKSLHSWPTRTEPFIVQKCGSASGISTLCSAMVWHICRQSVLIMLVAVGIMVALRNSAMTSRPLKPASAPTGSSQ